MFLKVLNISVISTFMCLCICFIPPNPLIKSLLFQVHLYACVSVNSDIDCNFPDFYYVGLGLTDNINVDHTRDLYLDFQWLCQGSVFTKTFLLHHSYTTEFSLFMVCSYMHVLICFIITFYVQFSFLMSICKDIKHRHFIAIHIWKIFDISPSYVLKCHKTVHTSQIVK